MVNDQCTDIDECEMNMCHMTMCQNLPGSFECFCQEGYEMEGTQCVDVNECKDENRCPHHSTCRNNPGSFSCNCNTGYEMRDGLCVQVRPDPCENCDTNAYCLDDSCSCLPGWAGDGFHCSRMKGMYSIDRNCNLILHTDHFE